MPDLVVQQLFSYSDDRYFSLFIKRTRARTLIDMQITAGIYNTRDLPATYRLLVKFLPNVLKSKCFNNDKIPFSREVQETEIGHLFEHILLEYLCELKIAKGYEDVTYSGTTDWNWYRNPRGSFHVDIDSGIADSDIFPLALEKSMLLLKRIMIGSCKSVRIPS